VSGRKDSVCQRGSGRLNMRIAQSFSPEKVVIVSKKNRRKQSMKSLFSENDIVLPEWLGILLEKVDRDTVQELFADHEEYQTFCAKRKELLNQYPVIETLLEDSGEVRISEQEHQAVLEYFQVRDKIENKERLYHYLYGHIHCYEYMKKIGVIKHENQ